MRVLDWSRARTWVLLGLVVAVLGAVIQAAQDSEGGVGQILIVVGVLLMLIGAVAYVVTQVRKAAAASRDE